VEIRAAKGRAREGKAAEEEKQTGGEIGAPHYDFFASVKNRE